VSPRRTLIIIVAIVIAAVAAVANILYLNSVQDRANSHAKLLKVFVVNKTIAKGTDGATAISQGLIQSGNIPAQYRPATGLTDINQIKGKVALTALSAGQVVVDGQFVDPVTAQVTFSQRIPAGQVAISMDFDSVHAVANLLLPGDKVNMIIPCDATKANGPAVQGGIVPMATYTTFYQNVTILAIGNTAAPQAGETQAVSNPGGGTLTFALPPAAAERLLMAKNGGQPATGTNAAGQGGSQQAGVTSSKCGSDIYLALVPPDNQPTQIPTIDPGNFFGSGLTPYQQP